MTDPSSLPADSLDQAATRMGGESRTDSPEQRTPGDTLASLGQLDTGTDSRSSLTDLPDGEDGDDADRETVDLESRYEFGAVLGRGGMGEVIRATDRRLKRDVAIKRMRAELGASRHAMRRFLTEAISVAALNHFNVVQIFDYGHTADGPFLVMELVEGPTLAELLADGPLPLEQAVGLLRQLCDGLETAHAQGIIHRDIKPANILVTGSGTPKLTDFGLAKEAAGDGHTMAGAVLGTLDYMAPEQKQDSSLADARSDQWSLAATFYQMLTGDVPRVIEIEALPEAVREVVRRALKTSPAERFDSVHQFAAAVQEAADAATRTTDSHAELQDGQCPGCSTINEVARKFCRSCGGSLQSTCAACDAETRLWEQFCGECGADMPAVLAEKAEAARDLKSEIQSLQSSFRHVEALEQLVPLRNTRHAALAEYQAWADETWNRLSGELAELESQRNQLLQAAREQADNGHLSAARKYLVRIPGPMQNEETRQLAENLAAATAEVKQLAGEIQYAARARLYDGLEQNLNRYLELKPRDSKAVALLRKVRERNQRSKAKTGTTAGTASGTTTAEESQQPAEKQSLRKRILWITVSCVVTLLMIPLMLALMNPQNQAATTPGQEAQPSPEVPTGLRVVHTLSRHTNDVTSVAFSPDGQTLATASEDYTTRLWSVADGTLSHTLHGHSLRVNQVVFSLDGRLLATGSEDNTARVWSVADGSLLHWFLHTDDVNAIAFSPDGRSLATASDDNLIRMWSVDSGGMLFTLNGHESGVNSVAFSPDGRTLATTSFDSTARLWSTSAGTLQRKLTGHSNTVVSATFSPDGQILATAGYDRTVRLWSVADGTLLHRLSGHTDWVGPLAFSPDGRTLASGSFDRTARLWSVADGSPLHTLSGQAGNVLSLAFHPNGGVLATGNSYDSVILWATTDGQMLQKNTEQSGAITTVTFSPDGSLLATGGSDDTARLWAVEQ